MDAGTPGPRPIIDRTAVLAALGADAPEIEEVLRYTRREHDPRVALDWERSTLALPDEPFAATWAGYLREAETGGVWQTLRRKLVQLRFPIRPAQSTTPAYLAATRHGAWPDGGDGLELRHPAALTLSLHPTAAGRVPVLYTPHRPDFVKLTQALAHRNEPRPVLETQRATLVAGYNNWDRLRALRTAAGQPPTDAAGTTAARHPFLKACYQDTIILLSGGAYSAVPAARLGLADEEWERLSLVIRREHECAHHVVRRFLGRLSHRADDELLADFVGLAAAMGRYPAEWALRFLGLEESPRYRAGGRLENYRHGRPLPALSTAAFRVLAALTHRAARQLEAVLAASRTDLRDPWERTRWLLTLSTFTLEELAAPATAPWLVATLGRPAAASVPSDDPAKWRPASSS